jgi:diguanylate cyclase (GGDEF)-like protein
MPASEELKFLIVEDDADQRMLITETLEDHFGKGVVTAVSRRAQAEALDLASFDLILSDYNLADSCGMALLEHVRATCNTPFIMVTGENVGTIAVEAIRKGATDYVVKTGDYLFTIPLVIEKNLAIAKIKRENEELHAQLHEKARQLEQMAATDALTGLYNRRHFNRVVEQLFAEAHRYDQDLACVMIDMDGFKQINDARGHLIGDQVIACAARVISVNLRKMDIAARYGGDEFVLLLPRQGITEARLVAERIREEYRFSSSQLLDQPTGMSLSVGIASIRTACPSGPEQLIAAADSVLYRAKEAGRDRVLLFEPVPVSSGRVA